MRQRVIGLYVALCREHRNTAKGFLGITAFAVLMLLCQGCGFNVPPGTDHNLPLINGAQSRSGVHTLTGSFNTVFTSEAVDLAIDGRGPSPLLVRTYNSNDPRVTPPGP